MQPTHRKHGTVTEVVPGLRKKQMMYRQKQSHPFLLSPPMLRLDHTPSGFAKAVPLYHYFTLHQVCMKLTY